MTIGTASASIDDITYNVAFNNKSKEYNGVRLWAGTSKGSASK